MSDAGSIAKRRRRRDLLATLSINAAGAAVIIVIVLILAYLLYVTVPLSRGSSVVALDDIMLAADQRYALSDKGTPLWRVPEQEDFQGNDEANKGATTLLATDSPTFASANSAVQVRGDFLQFYALGHTKNSTGGKEVYVGKERAAADVDTMQSVPSAKATFKVPVGSGFTILAFDAASKHALVAGLDERRALRVFSVDLTRGHLIEEWDASSGVEDVRSAPLRILLSAADRRLFVSQGAIVTDMFLDDLASASKGKDYRLPAPVSVIAWGPARETLLVVAGSPVLYRYDVTRRPMEPLGSPVALAFEPEVLLSEGLRRVTALLDKQGSLELLVPSSGDRVLRTQLATAASDGEARSTFGLSAGGETLYELSPTRLRRWQLNNPFPETGWRSLWRPHTYASYDAPSHSWHPDGAAVGVMSKFGLSPLLFGTFKAALFGLLLAAPLSLAAAVYTGYFLSSRRRNQVKPAVEMLEAFPTVVLGFIAGLWLAPILEEHLLLAVIIPLGLIATPLLITLFLRVSEVFTRTAITHPMRILPLTIAYVLVFAALIRVTPALEQAAFAGDISQWLWLRFEISYEQRNAVLVGLFMGIAITPVMFSIIEDSIYAVPRSLSDGSLALGATRWQSLARVVLPAASPAVLSAMLIGFARGLGETMIVLLATGNTPIIDMNLFSGLRSLSASIALELPEAAVSSVQFRLLFLAALMLFALTFLLNTVAEVFRQRLRYAYAAD